MACHAAAQRRCASRYVARDDRGGISALSNRWRRRVTRQPAAESAKRTGKPTIYAIRWRALIRLRRPWRQELLRKRRFGRCLSDPRAGVVQRRDQRASSEACRRRLNTIRKSVFLSNNEDLTYPWHYFRPGNLVSLAACLVRCCPLLDTQRRCGLCGTSHSRRSPVAVF